MKNNFFYSIYVGFSIFVSCNFSSSKDIAVFQCPMKCEGEKHYKVAVICPVCKMDMIRLELSDKKLNKVIENISGESIFNLTSTWNTQHGEKIVLNDLKGKTIVMVMIYTSCKAACPRLVADMRNIEKSIPDKYKNKIQYVLVSIDPNHDTPEQLKQFAKENFMDNENWIFLQGNDEGIRELANVLAMKYKQISPLDFSHSNIISVLNSNGDLVYQKEGLGVDNDEIVVKAMSLVSK